MRWTLPMVALNLIACAAPGGDGLHASGVDARLARPLPDGSPAQDADLLDAAPSDAAPSDAAPSDADPSDAAPSDAAPSDAAGGCPVGTRCRPHEILAFPYEHRADTRTAPASTIARYGCAPQVDEGGGEIWYRLRLDRPGLLSLDLDDAPGDGVDVDVHLLSGPDPARCVARDNRSLSHPVTSGEWWILVDTWVDGEGTPLAGPYRLRVTFRPVDPDLACAVLDRDVAMRWRRCDPSLDCYTADGAVFLRTPAMGPVVKEAHLVTVADDLGGGWPHSGRDGLAAHYALSEAATGYAMARREPWAPAGEGGSRWGQGATGRPLPVEAEAWYLNMNWADRPAPGTRLIVRNPTNGRAVVAAGGYETGPGANTAIAGVTEEIHDALGTGHLDGLEVGFAADQALPLGPLDCP